MPPRVLLFFSGALRTTFLAIDSNDLNVPTDEKWGIKKNGLEFTQNLEEYIDPEEIRSQMSMKSLEYSKI